MLGTHQGAIGYQHLDDYLNEFVFRFNRRKSASRGKLFFRLAQHALQIAPTTYEGWCGHKMLNRLSQVNSPKGTDLHAPLLDSGW